MLASSAKLPAARQCQHVRYSNTAYSTSAARIRSSRLVRRAGEPAQGEAPPPPEAAATPSTAPATAPAAAPAPQSPILAKGQGTAIITGAISVLFGVAYLVLVQLLDMRGADLQPPPPEAFLP
jgi:hypothetical protein